MVTRWGQRRQCGLSRKQDALLYEVNYTKRYILLSIEIYKPNIPGRLLDDSSPGRRLDPYHEGAGERCCKSGVKPPHSKGPFFSAPFTARPAAWASQSRAPHDRPTKLRKDAGGPAAAGGQVDFQFGRTGDLDFFAFIVAGVVVSVDAVGEGVEREGTCGQKGEIYN
jgi:hypothetical protein